MARSDRMLGKRAAALVVALALTAVGTAPGPRTASAAPDGAVAAQEVAVVIEDRVFVPTETRVPVGATVTWTNRGNLPHTATSQGNWDSGRLAAGATWSRQFDAPGTFAYICTIHPNDMRATLVVEEGPAGSTAPSAGSVFAVEQPGPPTAALVDPGGSRGSNTAFGGIGSINPGLANVGAVAGPGAAAAQLAPQGGSGVTGDAMLLQLGATTTVTVALSGLAPGSAHAGHIHQGSCNGPVLFPLETITADANGQGRATATVDAPLDLGTWWVQYHTSDSPPGTAIACGQVAGG
jgi:plastocyanin